MCADEGLGRREIGLGQRGHGCMHVRGWSGREVYVCS